MWIGPLWHTNIQPLQWGVVIGASLAAAVCDIATRRIPNLLTFPVFVGGLVFAGIVAGWAGMGDALLACAVLMLPFVVLFIFAGGGAGDAKLMGALGCWLGLTHGLILLVSVCLCGVVLALGAAAAKKRLMESLARIRLITYGLFFAMLRPKGLTDGSTVLPDPAKMQKVPYGIAIFAGTCLAAVGVHLWFA